MTVIEHNEFERRIVEHIHHTPGPGRYSARSALRHLERAWKLTDVMPEVAVFLAITAEEEAASALFHSLKRRGYEGADFLNHKSHIHKTALHPFLQAIGKRLASFPELAAPMLVFKTEPSPENIERLRLRFTIAGTGDQSLWMFPWPPLQLTTRTNGVLHDFKAELRGIASEKNVSSIRKYIDKLANQRNTILYAGARGVPVFDKVLPFLQYRRSVVFGHLSAYLLVDPYSERQQFAQQALTAFVGMLKSRALGD